jgi:hypothetical protein
MRKTLIGLLALALIGLAGGAGAQTLVTTNVTANTVWSGEIVLDLPIFVKNGAVLTIQPGTIIRGQPRSGPVVPGSTVGSPGALIVTQDGQIDAQGTAANPIIMTTAAIDNVNNTTGLPPADGVPDDVDMDGFEDPWTGPADVFLDATPRTAPLAPLNTAGEANVALWGGLVILGNAPTNLNNNAGLGIGVGIVEGLTVPGFPAADAAYGASDATGIVNDDSGTYQYLSVRHAGDELGEGNELNGITVAGVGTGTTFEFIEVYCNFDDGVEWFGGTMDGSHINISFAGDDQLDMDQGYTGTIESALAIMPFFNENDGDPYGSASGDKAGEWDGDDYDEPGSNVFLDGFGQPLPFSNAFIYNYTVIGSVPPAGADFTPVSAAGSKRGPQMRNGFAGQLLNSIVVNTGTQQGYDVSGGGAPGYDVPTNIAFDDVRVTSSTFHDGAALPATELAALANGDAAAPGDGGTANSVNEAGFAGLINEDATFDPTGNASGKLDPSLKSAPIDPAPAGSSGDTGLGQGVNTGPSGLTYRGAFPFDPAPSTYWTGTWTALGSVQLLPEPGVSTLLISGVLGLLALPRTRRR